MLDGPRNERVEGMTSVADSLVTSLVLVLYKVDARARARGGLLADSEGPTEDAPASLGALDRVHREEAIEDVNPDSVPERERES